MSRGATDLVGVVGGGGAALQVGHLGVILRDDQRPLELQRRQASTSVSKSYSELLGGQMPARAQGCIAR